MKLRNMIFTVCLFLIMLSNCTLENSHDSALADPPYFISANLGPAKGSKYVSDPSEGADPDFRYLYVTYNSTVVNIYLYFYKPVTMSWGSPYVYLYDKIDNNDRDMIVFKSSTAFEVRRDKDANGHFETTVYAGTSITQFSNATVYRVSLPKGVLPDIGSRKIWAYSMNSKDRVPDSGFLEFSYNLSTSILDGSEGISPDHSELEIGFDDTNSYIELDFHNALGSLTWGSPYTYLYDLRDKTQNYMIAFNSTSTFQIRQDRDANGHFETLVYTGTSGLKLDGGKRFTITFPSGLIPSLKTKKMWSYTMSSKDRIPNSGSLLF